MRSFSRGCRWLLLVALVTCLGFSHALAAPPRTRVVKEPDHFWQTDFARALTDARRRGLPLLVHFQASWCGPCRQMERDVLDRPELKKRLNGKVVAVKVDTDRARQITARYRVRLLPTDLLISPDGTELVRTSGYQDRRSYLARMGQAVTGYLAKHPPRSGNETVLRPKTVQLGLQGYSPVTLMTQKRWRHGEEKFSCLSRSHRTGGDVLVHNATVLTGRGQTLRNHSILVRDGKIVRIASGLKPDPGMVVLDASGQFVMPGIIDTHSHIKITQGINESSQSIVPEVRVRDVVNTADVAEFRALAGGVTTARLLHGSANVVGGQDAVVKLKYGRKASEQILADAPQGVKFALGENVKFRTTRFPNTRMGVEATLNRAFLEAIDYRRRWQQYEKTRAASDASTDSRPLLAPRRDLRLEALADIVNHQKFIHSHCYRADEILMLLRVASNLGIRVWSLQHVLEGYKIAPEIAAHGASCGTFSDWWAYKVEAYDAIPHNAALLSEAGADVVIKSDDSELIRHLYQEAAKPIRYGNMPAEKALATITFNAARQLGLHERIGSIETGKDADLAIFNAHPLNSFARCETTLIEGEIYFSRQTHPTAMSVASRRRTVTPPPLALPSTDLRTRTLEWAVADSQGYALVGGTLHPVTPPPVRGTLLIEKGKISAIGADVKPTASDCVIDVTGLHIYPGLIDAGTTLGLTEIKKVKETSDHAEGGGLQPDLRAGVAINPDSELFPVARAGGDHDRTGPRFRWPDRRAVFPGASRRMDGSRDGDRLRGRVEDQLASPWQ